MSHQSGESILLSPSSESLSLPPVKAGGLSKAVGEGRERWLEAEGNMNLGKKNGT